MNDHSPTEIVAGMLDPNIAPAFEAICRVRRAETLIECLTLAVGFGWLPLESLIIAY